MKGEKVEKLKEGQRWVVSDIHGHPKTLQHLIEEKIRLQLNDQLFLLGDYLNRGPDSKGVIDYIMELQEDDYQVYPLRGNHEQMLLDSHERAKNYSPEEMRLPSIQRGRGLKDAKRQLYPKYLHFLENLPYYYELDNCFLVHAGFDFTLADPLDDWNAMLWISDFAKGYNPHKIKHKRVIYGHQTTSIQAIEKAIRKKAPTIPLDNGCYKYNLDDYGHLCALNLDTWELIRQKNLDREVLVEEF